MSGFDFNATTLNYSNCSKCNDSIVSQGSSEDPFPNSRLINVIPSSITVLLCSFSLFVLFRSTRVRSTVGDMLIANAVLGDLFGVTVLSFSALIYAYPMEITDNNRNICKAYFFLLMFGFAWTSWSSAILAYDRYDMISRPLRRRLTPRIGKFLIIIVVVVSALWASFPIMGWSEYRLQSHGACSIAFSVDIPEELNQAFYTLLFFALNYIAPLVIDAICFLGVLKIAITHTRRSQARHRVTNNGDAESPISTICSRTFIVVMVTITSNVVFTGPYLAIQVMRKFGIISYKVQVGTQQVVGFGLDLTTYNYLFNAILYVIFVKTQIRSALPCFNSKGRKRRQSEWRGHVRNSGNDKTTMVTSVPLTEAVAHHDTQNPYVV